jgi:hypothetical protein
LINSITAQQNSPFNWTVAVGATYGAFVEFGTKGKARVPAGFEDVAARFKGFKGNGGKLYDAIYQWVKRKGLTATYSVKTQRRSKFNQVRGKANAGGCFSDCPLDLPLRDNPETVFLYAGYTGQKSVV